LNGRGALAAQSGLVITIKSTVERGEKKAAASRRATPRLARLPALSLENMPELGRLGTTFLLVSTALPTAGAPLPSFS
jgi:hypothetical protein